MSDKNPQELNDKDLENVSGGAGGMVLPDHMEGMGEEEVNAMMQDPNFVGTPEWQQIVDLNSPKGGGDEDGGVGSNDGSLGGSKRGK